jgi:transposase
VKDPTPDAVIGAYQRLYKIEKTFRMAKSDLAVRPVYHRLRESIEAHLTIVFAAMAVSHWIETTTGWSIKKFVTTARRYRTTWAKIGTQTVPIRKPLPDDLREALDKIEQATR